jgi:hypothetical protein
MAIALSQCSPPKNKKDDWRSCLPDRTLCIAGGLDAKYVAIGKAMRRLIEGSGHALLVESPSKVAKLIAEFEPSKPLRGGKHGLRACFR